MNAISLQSYLESLWQEYSAITQGEVASYIPELLKADPEWFGIAVITINGHVYQVGDTQQPFTIQSISKPITYGIALQDSGVEAVLRKVDVEPSGEAFNSISLEPETGRPRNPMINAGAIATMALIAGDRLELKLTRLLEGYERYLGHPVPIDQQVYHSEKATGHRNRAIAYLLHNSNIIEKDPDGLLDLYFQQCSILVTCRDLALMAATLANNGVNPITSVRALDSKFVPKVLSVMSSCGMYDYSGAWIYEVGLPAKSGVGGGVMAVLPGQFGIAVFSPKLDERGNSVRGIAACRKISSDFGLHMLHTGRTTGASVVRTRYDAAHVPSKRTRSPAQTELLKKLGHKIIVFELQGDLVFASAEIIAAEVVQAARDADYLILDLQRVAVIKEGALHLLGDLIQSLYAQGKTALLTNIWETYGVVKGLKTKVQGLEDLTRLYHEDVDHTLEWCEGQLLAKHSVFAEEDKDGTPLAAQALCAGFTKEELSRLEALVDAPHL